MELIGRQKLIKDIFESLRSYSINDTRIIGDIMDIIEKEETIINLHGEFEYGRILAPCRRCGSYELLINTELDKAISNEYHKIYKIKFTCADCGKTAYTYTSRPSEAYREWNRDYVKSKIGQ